MLRYSFWRVYNNEPVSVNNEQRMMVKFWDLTLFSLPLKCILFFPASSSQLLSGSLPRTVPINFILVGLDGSTPRLTGTVAFWGLLVFHLNWHQLSVLTQKIPHYQFIGVRGGAADPSIPGILSKGQCSGWAAGAARLGLSAVSVNSIHLW